ncbi:MAG: ABC transporter substrate-binding protein [bacterium]|nr:MAG: ABC transporter substrate-binding protein [bacterium]
MNRKLIATLSLFLFTFPLTAATAAATGPQQTVEHMVNTAIDILTDEGLDDRARQDRVRSLVLESVDFRSMSQRILAQNWKQASPEERDRFVQLFIDLLEATYIGRIDEYSNEKVEFARERVKDDRAIVDTFFVTGDAKIPIDYKLLNSGGKWMIFDVSIEEVSLVSNFRETYSEIIRKDGLQGLLEQMETKIEELRTEGSAEK